MLFCTVVNCMDGRVQLPISRYLKEHFAADYVDTVTEAGPAGLLASDPDSRASRSIYSCIEVSVAAHKSTALAVVAHAGCAGNPISDDSQNQQVLQCVEVLSARYPALAIIGLWVDEKWVVHRLGED